MIAINDLLKEKGLTKTALAEDRLGIQKQNLNALLKNPTLATIERIAAALDVPAWQLLATPEQVKAAETLTCPHCGQPITIRIE